MEEQPEPKLELKVVEFSPDLWISHSGRNQTEHTWLYPREGVCYSRRFRHSRVCTMWNRLAKDMNLKKCHHRITLGVFLNANVEFITCSMMSPFPYVLSQIFTLIPGICILSGILYISTDNKNL